MRNLFISFILLLSSCADNQDFSNSGTQTFKSVRGSQCSSGCIWSTYAVSSGVQALTHYCDGQGCACVEEGNIYGLCSLNNLLEEKQDNQHQSEWSNEYNSYKGNRIADEAYWEASRKIH